MNSYYFVTNQQKKTIGRTHTTHASHAETEGIIGSYCRAATPHRNQPLIRPETPATVGMGKEPQTAPHFQYQNT